MHPQENQYVVCRFLRPPLRPPHQASACDRERRCLQESRRIEQQGRALQDAEGADGMHAGVHASSGHYGTDGVSAPFVFIVFYAYRVNTL